MNKSILMAIFSMPPALAWIALCFGAPAPVPETAPKVYATLDGHRFNVFDLSFSANGKTLASAGGESTKIWDVAHCKEIAEFEAPPTDPIKLVSYSMNSVALSPDGKIVGTGGSSMRLQLWDVETQKCITTIPDKCMATTLMFSPDGNSIAWNGSEIWVYDLKTKEKRVPLKKLKGSFNLAFTPKGKLLATELDGGPKEYRFSVWDSDTGNKQTFLNGHSDNICRTAFSADGKVVASAGWDHTVHLWDTATGKSTAVFKNQPGFVYALAFSPDGKIVAAGFKPRLDSNKEGGVRLYDTATGKVLADLTGYTTPVGTLAFSPDGKLLATDGLEGKIRIWTIPEVWTAGK